MSHPTSDHCEVCEGRDVNKEGIQFIEDQILPWVKKDLLHMRYPTHPLPFRHRESLLSIFAYGQAVHFNLIHDTTAVYYTEDKFLLKHRESLALRWGMPIMHVSEMRTLHFNTVCALNTKLS